MLTILGDLSKFERTLIKARTDVGIKARASKASTSIGRRSSQGTSTVAVTAFIIRKRPSAAAQ
jgi:DNA invertase Pin-like site-specific DNA recombinase